MPGDPGVTLRIIEKLDYENSDPNRPLRGSISSTHIRGKPRPALILNDARVNAAGEIVPPRCYLGTFGGTPITQIDPFIQKLALGIYSPAIDGELPPEGPSALQITPPMPCSKKQWLLAWAYTPLLEDFSKEPWIELGRDGKSTEFRFLGESLNRVEQAYEGLKGELLLHFCLNPRDRQAIVDKFCGNYHFDDKRSCYIRDNLHRCGYHGRQIISWLSSQGSETKQRLHERQEVSQARLLPSPSNA